MDPRLILLALGSFAGTLDNFVLPALLPLIGLDTGVTLSQAGYLAFAYCLTYAIAAPVLSALFAGSDRRSVLATAELVFGLAAFCIALAPTFPIMLAARVVLACGAALFTSMAQATAVAISPPERRGRAVSVVLTGGTIAAAVGVPIGALIAVHFGWRVTVAVTAVLGIVASGIIWVRLPRGIVGELRTLQERVAVLGNRGVPAALAMSVFYTIGAFAPGVYVAAIVTQTMHLGAVSIPFVLLANGLGAVAGGLMGGQLVDRLGSLRSFVLLVSVTIVMNGSISLLPVLPLPIGLPLLFCIYGLGGLTGWGIFACMLAILAGRAPQAVPLAISLNLTATNVGAAVAALVGGFALDHFGASSIGLVGAIFPLMALGVAILNRKSLAKGR